MTFLLYIDTNIYLRFYDSNQSEYKSLLKTIGSLSDKIFITRQIQHEINRNKANVFRNSFDSYLKQANNYSTVTLPEHLDNSEELDISTWNKERKLLIKELEKSNKKIIKIYIKKMTLISKSEDEVSKKLELLFKQAHEYTPKELIDARARKERGNPPGKQNDPLGDQINWEQLINKIDTVDELYIISNDHDILTAVENISFLNPVLHEELKLKNKSLKIKCFHSLSSALLTLKEKGFDKIQNLPSKEILKEIINKEESDFISKTYKIYKEGYDFRSEDLQRLIYMYKHAMISSKQLYKGLQNAGYNEFEIKEVLNSKV